MSYNEKQHKALGNRARGYSMTIHAIYENGVFRPLDAVALPENCQVEITILSTRTVGDERPLLRLAEIAQQFPDNPDRPTDFAAQHDHYLYGTPKRP
jgi:predicted DNA-binding antitoxin AbrB/MazE fold protein